jgi:hypothetical protein
VQLCVAGPIIKVFYTLTWFQLIGGLPLLAASALDCIVQLV